jgi:hypothetical protein
MNSTYLFTTVLETEIQCLVNPKYQISDASLCGGRSNGLLGLFPNTKLIHEGIVFMTQSPAIFLSPDTMEDFNT